MSTILSNPDLLKTAISKITITPSSTALVTTESNQNESCVSSVLPSSEFEAGEGFTDNKDVDMTMQSLQSNNAMTTTRDQLATTKSDMDANVT